ncbi:hemerythrin domain-containing protein [Nocardia sp. NBC_01503]|uniref:hemerythrin domain-containing protein n=1 Tax=Nocardia sp. NBC_01503 TaxID=2975997 RepID=UPI002E7BE7CA|nr:hemerythrin domain-containing protein [Nocardia sp. NBC_01503]WTL30819.1 hemerythrin domain-containing protein [Nocardia sp. NBC_01503]
MEYREDIVALLLEQHEQIKILLHRVESTTGPQRREPFDDLVRVLAIHESAEAEVVHPAARHASGEDALVEGRLEEESEAKQVLADLYEMGVEHPAFAAMFTDFAEAVREHAGIEEKEEFAILRERLSDDQRSRMAIAVRVAEAVAPTRPNPVEGDSPAANVLAGPPLALFDRVRHAVRDWQHKTER